jgi:hypothetical protein
MSKNNQRNLSEINLGNQTYDRGFADGFAGRPKSIKKSHRHAHRYHTGYRHGAEGFGKSNKEWPPSPGITNGNLPGVITLIQGEGAKALADGNKILKWHQRLLAWFRS